MREKMVKKKKERTGTNSYVLLNEKTGQNSTTKGCCSSVISRDLSILQGAIKSKYPRWWEREKFISCTFAAQRRAIVCSLLFRFVTLH